jgi:uncharacterized protein YbjT (DUF2867 family)
MVSARVLVLGATGYIGAQLVSKLLDKGYKIRACGRSISKLKDFQWSRHANVELVEADVLSIDQLRSVCQGCEVVYYLVHSMNAQHKDFALADRQAAQNMVQSAEAAGLKRIIYLGGLGDDDKNLSHHLRSRMEVSNIIQSGKVPATTLRAAMIIGKGSISFEILRALVKNLPIMITPRWVSTESQPIAVTNVLDYLVGCLESERTTGEIFDIGGPEIVSYRQLMDIYAQEAGIFKRFIIPVPFLTPSLSSLWIALVTPFPAYIARPLAEGLKNRVVCHDDRIKDIIPQNLINCRQAIRLAIKGNQI